MAPKGGIFSLTLRMRNGINILHLNDRKNTGEGLSVLSFD